MNTVGINSIVLWKMALGIRKEAMEKATQEYNSYVSEIRDKILKDSFITAYLASALCSSTDSNGETLDKNYSQDDIALETLFTIVQECFDFRVSNSADLKDLDLEKCGQDFWLTRNRHPAVFWDHNLGGIGDRLTEAAKKIGEVHLYVGDDKQIYQ